MTDAETGIPPWFFYFSIISLLYLLSLFYLVDGAQILYRIDRRIPTEKYKEYDLNAQKSLEEERGSDHLSASHFSSGGEEFKIPSEGGSIPDEVNNYASADNVIGKENQKKDHIRDGIFYSSLVLASYQLIYHLIFTYYVLKKKWIPFGDYRFSAAGHLLFVFDWFLYSYLNYRRFISRKRYYSKSASVVSPTMFTDTEEGNNRNVSNYRIEVDLASESEPENDITRESSSSSSSSEILIKNRRELNMIEGQNGKVDEHEHEGQNFIFCVPFLTPSVFVLLAFLSQLLRVIQKLADGSNHVFEEIIFGNLILLLIQSSICIASDVMERQKSSMWNFRGSNTLTYHLIDDEQHNITSSSC